MNYFKYCSSFVLGYRGRSGTYDIWFLWATLTAVDAMFSDKKKKNFDESKSVQSMVIFQTSTIQLGNGN